MADLVVCRDLTVHYRSSVGRVEALAGVDAAFARGALTAVVGPSGSGKSTLLGVTAGLVRPTAGTVVVGGIRVWALPPRQLRRTRRDTLTFVTQSGAENLLPQLTIGEQLSLTSRSQAERLLDDLAIGARADELPRALSGGEQARAALAVALARETPLLICDEPTAELDDESAARGVARLRAAADSGTAVVVATHDETVIAAADAVVRLDAGGVVPERAAPRVTAGRRSRAGVPALTAHGVDKAFGRVQAVSAATLEVPVGAVSALIGRSGSGKTTLLALLTGWLRPDAGSIVVHPHARDPATLAWHELAYVPQRFGLIPELTVRDNVELPTRLSEHADATWVATLLADLGLDALAERLPGETSIGQQQRTALARALALRPKLLLADEPTSHQDARWREATLDVLERAAASGTTTLVATHEPVVAARATAVWRMTQGRVEPPTPLLRGGR